PSRVQHTDLEAAKVCPSPAGPFGQTLPGKKPGAFQPWLQFVSIFQRDAEVERVSIHAVVADGMPAHDEAGDASLGERSGDFQQPGCRAHRSESSQPRLPCENKRAIKG